jgi:LytS/YehU family sensor histidine kinase
MAARDRRRRPLRRAVRPAGVGRVATADAPGGSAAAEAGARPARGDGGRLQSELDHRVLRPGLPGHPSGGHGGVPAPGALWQFVWGLVIYGGLAQAARAQQRLRAQEVATAGAELQALRAQLNPHFLFNTLHALTQLVREDPIATQDALERFGALMRYVLDAGRRAIEDVPLQDEIGFVRNYLALERLRLGDRLRVFEDLDPDALELAVPPLLLQPLVENAVRHGLAPRSDGGTIRLTARARDGVLAIEVSDDGGGGEPDAWRRSSGLGLKSVRRQLEARFPRGSHLEIVTTPSAGFAVRLRMPARLPTRDPAS